jgi:ubiquinone/menaquinone biosynthesis C-methylase UbiE
MSEPSGGKRNLSVGCGHHARAGWTNLDLAPLPGVDVVHDLDDIPLPFDDAAFDYIECHDILEHVRELPDVMRELHRITAPGGRLHVTGPHFSSYAWSTDPTHRRAFGINTFEFFATSSLHDRDYYFDFAYAGVEQRLIRFQKVWYQPWNWLMERLVNKNRKIQGFYESTGWARIFPAHNVDVVLVR